MSLLISSASKENLELSIDKSVDLDLARQYLGNSFVQELFQKSGNEQVYCWGLPELDHSSYQRIADYDEVLLAENRTQLFNRYGFVIGKIQNINFGKQIWPRGWSFIIFLTNIQIVNIGKKELVVELGFKESHTVQRPILIDNYPHGTISKQYGVPFSIPNSDYSAENVLAIQKRRVGHQGFATQVKKNYESKCAICGIHEKEFLVAGHISAWADDEENRLNPENGLCLCSMHDKAFECGYISLDDDYCVILNSKVDDKSVLYQQLATFDGKKINLPSEHEPDLNLLNVHREKHAFN